MNRHTDYAATNQRVLRITTWPKLKFATCKAAEVTEVVHIDIKSDCGNVRYFQGISSDDANALMYIPAAQICETAMHTHISKLISTADGPP